MSGSDVPWLALMMGLPFGSALVVRFQRDPGTARRQCLVATVLTLTLALATWIQVARDGADEQRVTAIGPGGRFFAADDFSAPLLALVALQFFLTVLATLRTKFGRLSFAGLLVAEGLMLATIACQQPWALIGLLAAGTVPAWVDLRAARKPTRVYVIHMAFFVALLVVGQTLTQWGKLSSPVAVVGASLLTAAVLLRSGVVPLHSWMTDLFDKATFATALLFVTPMVGAYAAVRLVLPIAPDWLLRASVLLSLGTALYAAGMAMVQRDTRRFFCYVFLSHASLVLVGLETTTPIGLTGGLCVWLAVGMSLAGFGLTLRSVEARAGRLSLNEFHGLYEHTAPLATLFLLTGLASIGFPGTVGFIGAELLVESTVQFHALLGALLVIAAALNGLAILQAYFRIFTGKRHEASIDLRGRLSERIAVLILAALIFGGGLYPQPGVASRYEVANRLLEQRKQRLEASTSRETSVAIETTIQRRAARHGSDMNESIPEGP